MADEKNPMVGARTSSGERAGDTNFSSVGHDVPLRFVTAAGVIFFNPEGFMADVVNSVNDLILSGFDSMEKFAEEALNLHNEEARFALRNGVDKIYNRIQDKIDEHLSQWESICREHYFNITSDARIPSGSDNKAVVSRDSREAAGMEDLQEQEEILDKELCSLRSQLITAERDACRMRRELTSLERKLAFGSEVIDDLENVASFDRAILEILKSADDLKNKKDKITSMQFQRCRHKSIPSIFSERNRPLRPTEILQLRPWVTDIAEDPSLRRLLSRKGFSDDVKHNIV